MKKVTLKSSKKGYYRVTYPKGEGREVTAAGSAFFQMVRLFEEFMSKDWQGKPTGFKNLRDFLSNNGFDPESFTISVKLKKGQSTNHENN